MKYFFAIILACWLVTPSLMAQTLNAPARSNSAPSGSEFAQAIQSLEPQQREDAILSEAVAGNVPSFLRRFRPVSVTNVFNGKTNVATFFVAPDYFAIGSDEDYFLTPLTPFTAQKIAKTFDCTLPTRIRQPSGSQLLLN